MVSAVYLGVSIPVSWVCLTKKGASSSTAECIALMKNVLELMPADKIDSLLADREFIGKEWFQWLKKQRLLFRLRIRGDLKVMTKKGRKTKTCSCFAIYKRGNQ